MGRDRDEQETRQMRTRRNGGSYGARGYEGSREGSRSPDRRPYPAEARYGPYFDRGGSRYYEDEEGSRYYDQDYYQGRYDRDRDSEREYYWRERESRQETRRTAYMVLGGVCVAVIALVAVLALLGDGSSQQTAGQAPQPGAQQAPQQAAPQQTPQVPQVPQQPQAPGVPAPSAPSSEQVEGLRADIERQLAEIRQSINQLRLEIWALFTSSEQSEQEGSS